jgi:hypothetical protein
MTPVLLVFGILLAIAGLLRELRIKMLFSYRKPHVHSPPLWSLNKRRLEGDRVWVVVTRRLI